MPLTTQPSILPTLLTGAHLHIHISTHLDNEQTSLEMATATAYFRHDIITQVYYYTAPDLHFYIGHADRKDIEAINSELQTINRHLTENHNGDLDRKLTSWLFRHITQTIKALARQHCLQNSNHNEIRIPIDSPNYTEILRKHIEPIHFPIESCYCNATSHPPCGYCERSMEES